jgi:mannose-P-dolichol utilization defect protein 1
MVDGQWALTLCFVVQLPTQSIRYYVDKLLTNGFPLYFGFCSAWGEASFLAIQTTVVAALVLYYSYGSTLLALSFIVGYGAVLYSLISDITPIDILWTMQAANVPIIVISKVRFRCATFRRIGNMGTKIRF